MLQLFATALLMVGAVGKVLYRRLEFSLRNTYIISSYIVII